MRDALAEARRVFAIELNSATDNPLVFGEEILSGGNFHGEPLAFQLDFLAVALRRWRASPSAASTGWSIPRSTKQLPPFLAGHAGAGVRADDGAGDGGRLVAENRVLSHPASTGSITTSGNKEDFVSMGMTSALKFQRVVRNTRAVLAIEALAAARALDLLAPMKTSPSLEAVRARIREVSPAIESDRPFLPRHRRDRRAAGTGPQVEYTATRVTERKPMRS